MTFKYTNLMTIAYFLVSETRTDVLIVRVVAIILIQTVVVAINELQCRAGRCGLSWSHIFTSESLRLAKSIDAGVATLLIH